MRAVLTMLSPRCISRTPVPAAKPDGKSIAAFLVVFCILSRSVFPVTAENNSAADRGFRICSQNLQRYGELAPPTRKRESSANTSQTKYLVERMLGARCDVVAVQEVWGETDREAKRSLAVLSNALSTAAGGEYLPMLGESFNRPIRNGFLLRRGRADVVELKSFPTLNVPKLSILGPAERYLRAPLILVLRLKTQTAVPQTIALLNMHLKSKVDGFKDPTHTMYETFRMEMAEGFRELALTEVPKSSIAIILGDRNNDERSATARILSGEQQLSDFSKAGGCKLSAELQPACPPGRVHPIQFAGLLESLQKEGVPYGALATYSYKRELSIIDEIYVAAEKQALFRGADSRTAAGTAGTFFRGSDHKLVWAEMN